MNFCRRCGQKLAKTDQGYVCGSGHEIFANPSPAMGVVLVNDKREVTLTVRGVEPGKGMLDFAGGYCELHETMEEAAARELNEELGLSPEDYGPLQYLMSVSDPYHFGGEINTALGMIYWARLRPGAHFVPGDDAAGFVTVAAKDIDFDQISSEGEKLALRRLMEMKVI